MKKGLITLIIAGLIVSVHAMAFAEGRVLYNFETGVEGWEIPDWAYEQDDYVGESLDVSDEFAAQGKSSLKMVVDFTGGSWRGAVAEVMEYLDWTPYGTLSVDVLVPPDAPVGLRAKLILTVGDDWKWTEMSKSVKLEPGKWVTISANLLPGSMDWKRTNPTDEFRADVRKIDVRVESNRKPIYKGPVYIDNIRVE